MNSHKFRIIDYISLILLLLSYIITALLIHFDKTQFALFSLTVNALIITLCFFLLTYASKSNAKDVTDTPYDTDEISNKKLSNQKTSNEDAAGSSSKNAAEFTDYTVDVSSVELDNTSQEASENYDDTNASGITLEQAMIMIDNQSSEYLNIVDIANEAVEELSSFASNANIIITTSYESDRIMLVGDKQLLKIMFKNVIDNSIKYMNQQGSLNIIIYMADTDIHIVLKDTGEGLSKEETEHVFELNFQGSNRISGNGLGLTQTKAIVNSYGGSIYAKSDFNKGMGIYINLPTT